VPFIPSHSAFGESNIFFTCQVPLGASCGLVSQIPGMPFESHPLPLRALKSSVQFFKQDGVDKDCFRPDFSSLKSGSGKFV